MSPIHHPWALGFAPLFIEFLFTWCCPLGPRKGKVESSRLHLLTRNLQSGWKFKTLVAESALPKPMSVSALTLPTKGNQGKETSLKMRATGEGILEEVAWVLKLTENLAMKTQEESYFRRKKTNKKVLTPSPTLFPPNSNKPQRNHFTSWPLQWRWPGPLLTWWPHSILCCYSRAPVACSGVACSPGGHSAEMVCDWHNLHGSSHKESTCNAGDKGDVGSVPGSGKFP